MVFKRALQEGQNQVEVSDLLPLDLAPLPTAMQTCSMLARTWLLTDLAVPVVAGTITPHHSPFNTSITIPFCSLLGAGLYPLFYFLPIPMPSFPVPFTSPLWWRQQGPSKSWYPTATLHNITTQKTSNWIFSTMKISDLALISYHISTQCHNPEDHNLHCETSFLQNAVFDTSFWVTCS